MARPAYRCRRDPTHCVLHGRTEARDYICGVGETLATQELCSGIRRYIKRNHLQTGVGHYGVFAGRRWSCYIYPIIYTSD